MKSILMKLAMIRDEGYPLGVTAPCHLNCPCGERLPVNFDTKADIECPSCDKRYSYNGWIRD